MTIGKTRDHRDRLEVLLGVVAEIAVERLVGGDRSGAAPDQGVTVGRGLGGGQRAGIAAGAGTVVDDEGVPDRLAGPFQHDASDHVAGAAAGKRNDHLDRPRRIALGFGCGAAQHHRQCDHRARHEPHCCLVRHGCSLGCQVLLSARLELVSVPSESAIALSSW